VTGRIAAAAAAAALVLAAPAAGSKPGDLGVPGMSERQLRSFETQALGPEHAAEHARLRAVIRRYGAAKETPLPAPKVSLPPSVGGRWRAPFRIPVIGINAIMLPTGKVMWFAYPVLANPQFGDPNAPNTAMAWLWDPAKGTGAGAFKRIDPPLWRDPADGKLKPANIWCSAATLTADGRVIVAGGNLAYKGNNPNFKGLNKVYTFDPWNETWTEQPDMEDGRWYPSEVRMPDGRVLIMGGIDSSGALYSPNLAIDLFKPSDDLDGRGTLTTLGFRADPAGPADPSKPPDGGLYPHLFWMPSGRVMVAGPNQADSWLLHDPTSSNLVGWDDILPASRRRLWGSAVLLPGSTKVELIGGSNPHEHPPDPPTGGQASGTTETYDESSPPTSPWQSAGPLNIGRGHLNTVLLPDSSMVTVGGGIGTVGGNQWAVDANGDQRQVELFHPSTDSWTLGAAQREARAYHSTAVLLPDATVVSAGDDYNGSSGPGSGIRKDTAEIYEPPYLFKPDGSYAPRPRITSAPAGVGFGAPFHVGTPDNVTGAALVAPGAATHANDMNQRVVPLSVTPASGGVDLAPPSGADAAPPGYYMLFLIDDKGVPSIARWVQLGQSPPAAGRIEITQRTLPASSARFSYGGAPFDGLTLANGLTSAASVPGGPSATVPGGHYTITQDRLSGYDLTAVGCSDSDSLASVALRTARINLAAGETVRCTFTDRRRPAGPGAGAGPPPVGDRRAPRVSLSGLNRRRGRLSGRVSDGSGVKHVDVALAVRSGKRCRWWSRSKRRFARRRASCERPIFFRARLKRSGSGYGWQVALHRRLPRRRYLVALKAVDGVGNVARVSAARGP